MADDAAAAAGDPPASLVALCRSLPKAELHAHLHGSLRPSTLVDLLTKAADAASSSAEAEAVIRDVLPSPSRSLRDCFRIFDLIHRAVTDSAAVERVSRETVRDAFADGVALLELRTTPRALRDAPTAAAGAAKTTTTRLRIPKGSWLASRSALEAAQEELNRAPPLSSLPRRRATAVAEARDEDDGEGAGEVEEEEEEELVLDDEDAVDAALSHYVESVVRGVHKETVLLARESWVSLAPAPAPTLAPALAPAPSSPPSPSSRPLVVRLLLSINRTEPLESAAKIAKLARVWARVRLPAHRFQGDVSAEEAEEAEDEVAAHEAGAGAGAGAQRLRRISTVLPPKPPAWHNVVVGLDVSGDPTRGSLRPLLALLDGALATHAEAEGEGEGEGGAGHPRGGRVLPVTVHAGEVMNVRETEEVLDWRPDRLGHMCVLTRTTVERLLLQVSPPPASSPPPSAAASSPQPPRHHRPIPIEICPSSNALTLHLPSLHHHPTLHPWLAAGYPISVCTDDSGVFSVTLTGELADVAHTHSLPSGRVRGLALAGFEHSFVEDRVKRWILMRAEEIGREVLAAGTGEAS